MIFGPVCPSRISLPYPLVLVGAMKMLESFSLSFLLNQLPDLTYGATDTLLLDS